MVVLNCNINLEIEDKLVDQIYFDEINNDFINISKFLKRKKVPLNKDLVIDNLKLELYSKSTNMKKIYHCTLIMSEETDIKQKILRMLKALDYQKYFI